MIINSLLDLDLYKITQSNFAFTYAPNAIVRYEFKNRRPSQQLADVIPLAVLKSEIEHVRQLMVHFNETTYLKSTGVFNWKFLQFFDSIGTHHKLPEVKIKINGDQFEITTEGVWCLTILWETIILSIINELYFRYTSPSNKVEDIGRTILGNKIQFLQDNPQIRFSDFGTRRRYSGWWQQFVLQQLTYNLSSTQFIGTSNVYLAQMLGIPVIGTMAHETIMVWAGLNQNDLLNAQNNCFDAWFELYGTPLSIALSDTFGTTHTLDTFGANRAKFWNGFRQDSGDPFDFAKKVIRKYETWGVDAREKHIVFSDDLNISKMFQLEKEFGSKIRVSFGWGTNLTNDLGPQALSVVMKAVSVNSVPLVKLSDDIGKHSGPESIIQLYQKIFQQ